jgi:hypothetical protein
MVRHCEEWELCLLRGRENRSRPGALLQNFHARRPVVAVDKRRLFRAINTHTNVDWSLGYGWAQFMSGEL